MRLVALKRRAAGALLLIAQAACGSGVEPDTGSLTRVEIEPGSVEVEVRSTVDLEARLLDEGGSPVGGTAVHWSVEDPDIAEVSQSGVVTGRSVGSTRVAASAQGMDAVATVKVLPRAVIRIRISPADVDLVEGQTANLSATLLDRADREIEDRSASWSSSNTKVAQVDDNGRVTAVGKGSAKIRATADGKTGESVVSVAARPVDRVEISPTSTTLRVGQNRSFSVTARASDDSRLDGRSVSWSSTNTSVVTINGEGLARAVGPGTAKVEARIEGKTASAPVTVEQIPVDRVEVSPSSATLEVGETKQFDATARASDGSRLDGRAVNWSSTKTSVVTIDSDGKARAVGEGTAKLEARIEGKTASASVTVRPAAVDRVEISPRSLTMRIGERRQFTATAKAANGSTLDGRAISWSSDRPWVASVTEDGRVTAHLWGEATITAKSEGKSATAEVRVRSRFGGGADGGDDDDDD